MQLFWIVTEDTQLCHFWSALSEMLNRGHILACMCCCCADSETGGRAYAAAPSQYLHRTGGLCRACHRRSSSGMPLHDVYAAMTENYLETTSFLPYLCITHGGILMQWNPEKTKLLLAVPTCHATERSILDTSMNVVLHELLLCLAVLSLPNAATQQALQFCM